MENPFERIYEKLERLETLVAENKPVQQAQPEIPEWLTIQEAADLLRLRKTDMYQLTHKRALPYYKVGRQLRFRYAEIMRAIEKTKSSPRNEAQDNAADFLAKKVRK